MIEIRYKWKKLNDIKGEKVFWSKDGKYLVTASLPSPFYEAELALHFYDFRKERCLVDEIAFDDPEKLKLYIRNNLVSAENSDDIKLIIIQKDEN